ncbi:DMT family transporter [Thiobacter aerophilum]|uniref:Guanidinium exporter n=1 Tax=Thiobacter aerophilum TaxID=3121275 RepID=A0ABV0EJ31_9BURK
MEWFYLFAAGIFEIVWAVSQKYSEGFTRALPTGITLVTASASFVLLGLAMKQLHLGTAYAVWTGIGIVGTALLGILLFHEPATPLRLLFIGLILIGIIGLKLSY